MCEKNNLLKRAYWINKPLIANRSQAKGRSMFCVSAHPFSTQKCARVCQWLIGVLAQQLWGCRPHRDVSVAMETAGAEEGLRLETREGSKRAKRGKQMCHLGFQAPSLPRHVPNELPWRRVKGPIMSRFQTGPKKVAPQLQDYVFGQRLTYKCKIKGWDVHVCVFTHHLSRTDLSCIGFSQTDNLRKEEGVPVK